MVVFIQFACVALDVITWVCVTLNVRGLPHSAIGGNIIGGRFFEMDTRMGGGRRNSLG